VAVLKARRRGRPLMGTGPADVCRFDRSELRAAIAARRGADHTTASKIIREALVGSRRRLELGLEGERIVLIVRGTKKLRDRVKGPLAAADAESTTTLGDWFATVLFWRPQVALLVNERTCCRCS